MLVLEVAPFTWQLPMTNTTSTMLHHIHSPPQCSLPPHWHNAIMALMTYDTAPSSMIFLCASQVSHYTLFPPFPHLTMNPGAMTVWKCKVFYSCYFPFSLLFWALFVFYYSSFSFYVLGIINLQEYWSTHVKCINKHCYYVYQQLTVKTIEGWHHYWHLICSTSPVLTKRNGLCFCLYT